MSQHHLSVILSVSFVGLSLAATGALAQSAALPDSATPHPAGPVETYRSIERSTGTAPDGTQLDSVHRVERSQSFTDGNGELSARTHVEESGGTQAVAPPMPLVTPPGAPLPPGRPLP